MWLYTVLGPLSTLVVTAATANPNTRLWYDAPAELWTEALPIGNGFIGAMVFGDPVYGRMQVNEDSVYSGGFRNRVNQNALETLPEVRELLGAGQAREAEQLAKIGLTATPQSIRHYETLGEMEFEFYNTGSYDRSTYRRWLDLETAIAGVNFDVGDTTFTEEMFSSFPDKVIVHNIKSSGSRKLGFHVRVHRPFGGGNSASDRDYNDGKDTTYMVGGTQSLDPIEFATGLTLTTDGDLRAIGEFLVVTNATEATVYFAAATSYRHKDPLAAVDDVLNKAKTKSYEQLKERHVEDYQQLFNTFSLDMGGENTSGSDLPTNKRINATQAGANDPGLVALEAQYGRYMLISSSREGSLPANLQGLWCEDFESAWGSKYTVNIK